MMHRTPPNPARQRRNIAYIFGGLVVIAMLWHYAKGCDYLIADVRYLQGEKINETPVYVGITEDKISYIGQKRVRAKTIIPGTGLILAPGMIDANSCGWLGESAAILKLKDGITTFLNAHGDRFKATPSKSKDSEKLNYATSVGLIPVHANHLTGEQMMTVLEESLRYGAYTISLSPEYTAETTPAIVTELSRYFAHKNVLFTFHLRYSSESEELAGILEAIDCATQGNAVHIMHITSTGATYHPEKARQMIDAAAQRGLKITYDFYPYTAWSSSIHRARFTGDWQERYRVGISNVSILGEVSLTNERFEELKQGTEDRMVSVESIPQATVDYFALNTTCPIGTDSEANVTTTHPRGAGSFTKFINDYVDTGKIDFGKALYRFSTATAILFAPYIPDLTNRGVIGVGYKADLVLWDRGKIKTRADFANPHEPSLGVVAAFVNGVPLILDGKAVMTTKKPGRHLKGVWAN